MVLKDKGASRVREVLIHGPGGTGKSRGILEWLWWVANEFHGVRILLARKTRVSLTEAGLVTLEEQVIPVGHPCLDGPTRANRAGYSLKNGSEIVIGGMDHPTRLYSTDWDIVYIQEAQELLEDEWERLRRGLRHFAMPLQVLLGDCNPEGPQHWLYRRMKDKKTEGWESRHWDNPKWYRREPPGWTEEGKSYLESLARLTGVRRDRLYRGEWVAASGAVWDNWDTAVHVIDRPKDLAGEGITKFFGSLDWGFASAGCFQVWGVDQDQRIYLVAEWYRTEQQMGWWMERVAEAHKEFDLMCVVADPSRPDSIQIANDYLSRMGVRRLMWAAHNRRRATMGNDMGGIDLVRHKLDKDKAGKPSIFVFRDSLRGRDQKLAEMRRCTSLAEEIPGYVYLQMQDGKPSKEQTDPQCDDHGCDALRYAACFMWMRDVGETPSGGKFKEGTWGQVLGFDEFWESLDK
jgi:phage terminase large subunit